MSTPSAESAPAWAAEVPGQPAGGPQRAIPVERLLASYCRERRCRFLVSDQPEPALRVMMPEAFLPVLALQAEVAAVQLLGPRPMLQTSEVVSEVLQRAQVPGKRLLLGTQIRQDVQALFGVYASVEPLSGDGKGSLRAALFVYAFHKVFGAGADRAIELSEIFTRYAGQGLRGILDGIEAPSTEAPWSPASPH